MNAASQIFSESPNSGKYRLEPIVDLITGKAIGQELLAGEIRCPSWTAGEWRDWYLALETMVPDLLARRKGLLFINVDGCQLLDVPIRQSLRSLMSHAERIVIEWTEQSFQAGDMAAVLRELDILRGCGFRLAVDDIGAGGGVDGLGRAVAVAPQFCKIDGAFFLQCREKGPEHLRGVCQHLALGGSRVVAEWIETEEDYRLALAGGAHLGQGFYWRGKDDD